MLSKALTEKNSAGGGETTFFLIFILDTNHTIVNNQY